MEDLAWVTGEIHPCFLLVPKGFGAGVHCLPALLKPGLGLLLAGCREKWAIHFSAGTILMLFFTATPPQPPTMNAFSFAVLLG